MQTTFALVALASVASAAIGSSPSSSSPAGCSASYSTPFQITIINSTSPVAKRASTCGQAGYLTATLKNGILMDSQNRQGEVVANYQFQFDDLLQPDAVYTQGFSVCNNGSLALGGSNIFYQCQTTGGPGIGTYSNLYDRSIAPYCEPILINILPCPASAGSSSAVSQAGDGQAQATTVGTAVSQITDGQVQATGTAGQVPVSQISDGQIQVTTAAPGCVVSQISDGQVQFTVCAHPTGAPVSQISDGQVQATATGAPVSQISDGQVQATATGAPVSQISDGQIQATTLASITTGAPVSQISDGQIQATKAPNATATPLQVTAAGNGLTVGSTLVAIFVGLAGVLLL